jgi:hypothetical protein
MTKITKTTGITKKAVVRKNPAKPLPATQRFDISAAVTRASQVPDGRYELNGGSCDKTSSDLLWSAALELQKSIGSAKGHLEVMEAANKVAEDDNYPVSTLRRAKDVLALCFTDPSTGRLVELGKTYSESGDKYAKETVKKNGEVRVAVLKAASHRARFVVTAEDRTTLKKLRVTAPGTNQHAKKPEPAGEMAA